MLRHTIHTLAYVQRILLFFFITTCSIFSLYANDNGNKEIIYQRGKIVIGDDVNFPPYSFMGENGQPTGFNIDIAKAAGKAMGLEVEIKLDSWGKVRESLEKGEIDAISGMFYSTERDKLYEFTSRHSVSVGDIFSGQNIMVNSLNELAGKEVLVQKADIIAEYLEGLDISIKLVHVSTVSEALRLVELGEYEYAAVLKLPGLYEINLNQYQQIQPQGLHFFPNDYCIAVREGNEDLLYILNAGLHILKASDEYHQIHEKWLGVYEDEMSTNYFYRYRWAIFIVVLVVITLLITSLILKYLVNKKTKELRILNNNLISSNNIINSKNEMLATSQAELRSRLEEIEKQGEMIRFKQNFLANMSHEIRTPLTGILGMVDILEHSSLNKEQLEYINILKHSGENLREIINQVLDYSKIEAGKVQLNKKVFDFGDIVLQAESIFKSLAGNLLIFEYSCDPNIPSMIMADKNRIIQMTNNLISNSVKFTPKGKISLHAEKIKNLSNNKEIFLKISITDTGLGITAEKQKVLFRPFAQIHESDQRDYEGTGLGLSICKELAELQGGEIGVESTYGKGSTFWFTFIAAIGEDQFFADQITPSQDTGFKEMKILLAEDNVVNQKVIRLLLTSFGHQVEIAENGQKALDIYEPGKFDLILMDIQMPVMDGITSTKQLRLTHTNLPPIVGLSANAFEGDREKYISLGLDEYLTKPFKKDDFVEVMEILNRKES